MSKFKVFLKSGGEFTVRARDFTVEYSVEDGAVARYTITGMPTGSWLFINVAEIAAVVKVS